MNQEKQKSLKVSDWSQPIKITIFLGFAIAVALFVWLIVVPFGSEALDLLREIAENTSPFQP